MPGRAGRWPALRWNLSSCRLLRISNSMKAAMAVDTERGALGTDRRRSLLSVSVSRGRAIEASAWSVESAMILLGFYMYSTLIGVHRHQAKVRLKLTKGRSVVHA